MVDSLNISRSIPLLLLLFCSQAIYSQRIVVVHDKNLKEYGTVKLLGLDHEIISKLKAKDLSSFNGFFYMQVDSAKLKMLGTYSIKDTMVIFNPRFLPDPTMNYLVYFDSDKLEQFIGALSIEIESLFKEVNFNNSLSNQAHVIGLLPNSASFPSNVLRLYIAFSAPMGLQNPYHFISLHDESGHPVNEPFVEIPEGLWNDERTRLTVLFHPGRIKRGVGPNVKNGAIFQEGKRYEIRISSDWKTNLGKKLDNSFSQPFAIGPAIRERIDLLEWKLTIPASKSLDPLILKTSRQLDPIFSPRMIEIIANGKSIVGKWEFDSQEFNWKFLPIKRWHTGIYTLHVNPKLEDLSGNTVAAPFDIDNTVKVTEVIDSIPFEVK